MTTKGGGGEMVLTIHRSSKRGGGRIRTVNTIILVGTAEPEFLVNFMGGET